MQWFRLYSEIVNDPKVMVLPEHLRWRYVALLCLQCDKKYEGRPEDEIAFSLRITVEELNESRNIFVLRGLLAKDYSINSWEKRQYISDLNDPTAAERQRRHRDKRNATVTSRLPDQTQTRTEPDTDQNQTRAEAKNGFRSFHASANGFGGFEPSIETADAALSLAPGWDHNALIQKYNEWHVGKERPRDQERAYLGWLKNFTKGRMPS